MRAVLALLLVVFSAVETSGRPFFRQRIRPKARVNVQQVIAAPQTLFLVAPPSYYGVPDRTPPAVAGRRDATNSALVQGMTSMGELLLVLEQRLGRLESRRVVVPLAAPSWPPLLSQKCGRCHDGDDPKGGFHLEQLSNPARRLLAQAFVLNAKMPLDADGEAAVISGEDRAAILAAIVSTEEE